ncbi:MAG: cohesin domain-containing protein, partial [Bacteroidota bacterium]
DANDNGCNASLTITDPGSCSNANALSFVIGSGDGITCGSVFIPITVLNYTDILGGQGSINWNPAVASLVATSDYGVPDLTSGSLSQTPGELNFSYNDNSQAQLGHTLADGDTLILLEFDISNGVLGGSSPVEFSSTVPALFFDVSLSIINPLATAGTIDIPSATNISGKATTEIGTVINGVTFKMSGDDNPPTQVGTPGYDFNFTRCGTDEIGAFKNNDLDVDQGVNTLDIIFIQRQILGIAPLNSPYKNIAADVNNNGLVEGLDITFIRQLILQIRQAFPEPMGSNLPADGTRLWAFVPSDAVFPVPFTPIAFDTGRVYNPINPLTDQDFIGMKLGDVDNSWDLIANKTGAVDDITFEMPDLSANHGDEIIIPVSVKDFSELTGYQFTMSWDPSVLAFHEVVNKELQTVFGEQETSNGHLTASWNDAAAQAISLDDGTVVFELHFKVIGQSMGSTSFSINSLLTQSEAYNDNLELLDILSSPATISLGGTTSLDPEDNQGFGLYQNMPNPFDRYTNIAFELPSNNEVKIEIYNSLGQVIKTFEGLYSQGKHQIRWDGTNETGMQVSAGVYYARMQSADFNGTIQMQRSAQ